MEMILGVSIAEDSIERKKFVLLRLFSCCLCIIISWKIFTIKEDDGAISVIYDVYALRVWVLSKEILYTREG